MAVTSLWRVKGYIGKVLLYAENPDKTTSPETIPSPAGVNRDTLEDVIAYAGREEATNQRQLVTGINCNAGTARSEMMAVITAISLFGRVRSRRSRRTASASGWRRSCGAAGIRCW